MNTLIQSLSRTCELIWEIALTSAEDTYKKVKGKATIYLKALAVSTFFCLALILALALLKAYTGITAFAYMAFIFMAIFALILGTIGLPLGTVLAMLKGRTADPIVTGGRYVRFVGILFFAELMITMYLVRVPLHQNTASILPLLIVALAVAVGSLIWGGLFSGKFYVFVATVIMFMMTLSFFVPETFAAISSKFDGLDSYLARMVKKEHSQDSDRVNNSTSPSASSSTLAGARPHTSRQVYIEVRNDMWSREFVGPPGASIHFDAPGELFFKFPDGTIIKTDGKTDMGKIPSRRFRLRGTPGIVTITILSPDSKQTQLSNQTAAPISSPRPQENARVVENQKLLADAARTRAKIDSAARAVQQPKRSALEILDSTRAAQDSINRVLASRYQYH